MFKKGEKVVYKGPLPEKFKYGTNSDPNELLVVGKEYTIKETENDDINSSITLEEAKGIHYKISFTPVEPPNEE